MAYGTALGHCLLALTLAIAAGTKSDPCDAADWADSSKILKVAFASDISGLDPAAIQDLFGNSICRHIFDALYMWDYLARPYQFVPKAAAGMPEVSADGRIWTIRIKPGIYFTDDPAFGGKRRELVAADFVYEWKRVMDPRVRSPNTDLLERKIVGLDAAAENAKTTGKFDYDADIQGLRAIDRYTLRIELVKPDYMFLYVLNAPSLAGLAREVVEKYQDGSGRVMSHPVGTGSYKLKEWQPNRRIVLEANPGFRDVRFPAAPANADATTKAVAEAMKNKRLPQIGRVEVSVIEETNPRLLMFNNAELDLVDVPGDVAPKMIDAKGRLLPEFANRGIVLDRGVELTTTFSYFNMEDPVVGGYTPEKVALRRAICSAYNVNDEIRVIRNNQGMPATQPIPPGAEGHVANFKGFATYDPATARALLDKFGYRAGSNGVRTRPDGSPLVIRQTSAIGAVYRQFDDLWSRNMRDVGIHMEFDIQSFQEAFKASHMGKLQFAGYGWSGDDADDFMRLFYGPNSGSGNLARFRNTDFDALYEKSHVTPDDAERSRLYEAMTKIVSAQAPWCINAYRISNTVTQPWIRGYRKNAHFLIPSWWYLDIDAASQKARRP